MHAVLEYQNSRRRARGCWLAAGKIECVLLLQNVFPYSRMCSLTLERADAGKIECVLYYRMCSLTLECVLLL